MSAVTATFNGTASTHASFDIGNIVKLVRPIYPGSRVRMQPITGRMGVYFHGKDRKELYIPVRFYFASSSMANKRTAIRAISDWLDVDEPKVLTFSDEPLRRYYAIPINEIVPDEALYLGYVNMTFLVPAGYAESTTTKTASPNAGTLETPVQITATMAAAASELIIALSATEYLQLTMGLLIADVVIFNTETRTCTVNGTDSRRYLNIGSTWFTLPVGAFALTPTPVGTTVAIVYRERFK